ncbi:putative ATP-dependent helicase DinG [Borrelia miyamotoi]|uniref:Helicase C-terminal domain-containing protein n=1 Tax=Borrelia miyamotoi TaxID=47466 RepID=A0AAP9CFG8_9SPIR|nr:helicase C-terminal domain-containing protein [Borrelia miyamotoi]AHH04666.1 ATP-dependent helicase, DinG family protein [Borrelia miyamotoi FR64b]ATQ14525.1 helicase C-terminal domain-containing protein [Borrelia miyamotoi]ATQ15710.1 helicase C-terminal domain-containing protein [Borrelia miyamotoi]ATQ16854.1 helicase C-terminal domain-containing protein [Borrelia miyamotoi]ATQ18642.1 DEAD/DEAH box helicase [Borrelia miyamotoi]
MNLTEYILKKAELNIKGFIKRDTQLKMIEKISKAFENESFLVIEAPTGTGKSLAYLIAAIDFIQKTQEKVIISTASINLQEQLIKKDIEYLKKIIPFKMKFGIIKGMRNYLCLRRLKEFEKSLLTYTFNKGNLETLIQWAKNTKTGDKDELNFIDEQIWEEISASPETCSGITCPDENKCFFKKARKKILESDIIITNHHLLLNDLYIKNEILITKENYENNSEKNDEEKEINLILPNIKNIIIDEAHYLEEAARTLFSNNFSRIGIKQIFTKIDKIIKRQNIKSDFKKNFEIATMLSFENIEYIIRIQKDFPSNYRIINDTHKIDSYIQIKTHLKDVIYNLENYRATIISIIQNIENKIAKIELNRLMRNIELKESLMKNFISENQYTNLCAWIENKNNTPIFKTSEIHLGSGLNKIMHKRVKRIIFTSATMIINQSFSYFINQMGLNLSNRDIKTERLPCSFPYKEKSILTVISSIENPNKEEEFLSQSIQYIKELVILNKGGTLILLTSFKSLEYTSKNIKDFLIANDINLFIQGQSPKHKLINSFKKSKKKSVLIGIKNFWEGIDIKGDKLTMVIIPKLPFQNPLDPILMAKNELAIKENENFFTKETLPRAIMKFKQGFGRLIRDPKDYGIIVCFDKRIFEKTYGTLFLQALPDIKTYYSNFKNVKSIINTFFKKIDQNTNL